MVGRGINGIYRCQKIVKICGKREHGCTHRPFDLEADVAPKERGRTLFSKKTLDLSVRVVTGQVGVTTRLSHPPQVRID